jgi:nickel-dependent lactate racemase
MTPIKLPVGKKTVCIDVPGQVDMLSIAKAEPLDRMPERVRRSLADPLGAPPLTELAAGKETACVVVSDNTRPVPYKGKDGVLPPLVETLQQSGIQKILILIACGTHRPMNAEEIRDMLGDTIDLPGVEVINHVATDDSALRNIGSTKRTPEVTISRHYLDADLKILTGLVEPHFMAGFSGGRKAVCPGISGQSVTYGFHSAAILSDPGSTSLNLTFNPCHDESLTIAKMAGVDFILNVTINSEKKISGVFAGELEQAHRAAVDFLQNYVSVYLDKEYDIVITQAGEVGVNHYQCAKAVVEASRAVKPSGSIVLLGNLSDPDPVGGGNYKKMLRLLSSVGHDEFIRKIRSADFEFVPEQWQVQMWARVFEKLGAEASLLSCLPQLENIPDGLIPETNVSRLVPRNPDEADLDYLARMVETVLEKLIPNAADADVLVLPDGPYAVPVRG